MTKRVGTTVSFSTDLETRELLEQLAKAERRTVSNMLTTMILDFAERRGIAIQPAPGNGKHVPVPADYTAEPS